MCPNSPANAVKRHPEGPRCPRCDCEWVIDAHGSPWSAGYRHACERLPRIVSEHDPLRILIAIASQPARAHLRRALSHDPTIQILDESLHALQTVERALTLQPQLILCDEPMVSDAALL